MDIIVTNRLVLRSACDSDLGPLHDIVFSDPEVMAQAFEGKPLSRNKSAEFFASSFDHDGNGKQLGVLTLKKQRDNYWFRRTAGVPGTRSKGL